MRIRRITIKGFGPIRERVTLDLDAIDQVLIAVVGENGAGKSTLLESGVPGALYRTMPTRGDLIELATDRDSYTEVTVDVGKTYTIRQKVDVISGKPESLVLDESGRTVLPDTKVSSYDAWAAKTLPAESVLLTTTFCPQKSGGFFELSEGKRKEVLLKALGVDRLEEYARVAREKLKEAKARCSEKLAVIVEIERSMTAGRIPPAVLVRSADPVDEARASVERARATIDQADESLRLARRDLIETTEQATKARAAAEQAKAVRERRAELLNEKASLELRQRDLTQRLENNRLVLESKDKILAAVTRTEELDRAIAVINERRSTFSEAIRSLAAQVSDAEKRRAASAAKAQRLALEAQDADKAAIDLRAKVQDASQAIESAVLDCSATEKDMAAFSEEASLIEARISDVFSRRVDRLRDGMDDMSHWRERSWACDDDMGHPRRSFDEDDIVLVEQAARGHLRRDDQWPDIAQTLREKLAEVRSKIQRVESMLKARQARLASLRESAAMAPQAEQYEKTALDAARNALEESEHAKEATRMVHQVSSQLADVRKASADATEAGKTIESERDSLSKLVNLAPRLSEAQARIEQVEESLQQIATGLEQIASKLAALPADVVIEIPDVSKAQAQVEKAERTSRDCQAHYDVAASELQRRQEVAQRLSSERALLQQFELEVSDWNVLAKDLGKDGLQALEIDAAGPDLSKLVNDLLHTCVSSRWSVSVETSRPASTGKKTVEGCRVRVIDTMRGREGDAERLSGGEEVLVGEAFSLGLTMLACQRAGITGATLIRDESGAALDGKRVPTYVAMLRRAASIVGARHVLFVSHLPAMQELADVRVMVADGRIEVQP